MERENLIQELAEIRKLMEKSSKFISISGISSVLIGIYALLGAFAAYLLVYGFNHGPYYRKYYIDDPQVIYLLFGIALLVLCCSLLTGYLLARQKARRNNQSIWNVSSKNLLEAVAVPLIAGGLLCLIFMFKSYYVLIASTTLIFYGLALFAGANYTFKEIKWLGLMEISLGLLALCFPGYGLWFWALGFGVLHIIYGLIVHKKYE